MNSEKKPPIDLKEYLNPAAFSPPDGYKPGTGDHSHQKSFTSTRTATFRGHKIKVKTTYRIEIDGEPLTLHTVVLNDGTVHCHGLPNYSFPSAIDLAKAIISASQYVTPVEDELGSGDHEHDPHGNHEHGGHH